VRVSMRPCPFLDGRFGDEFGDRSGAEIVHDIGFEGGLVALEREQVIGLVGDDLVGDVDLAAHSVDGDQGAFELLVLGELVEKLENGGDLVGLFRDAELRQGQPGGGGVGAQRVQGFQPLAMIVGAARGLAVDGDELMPPRPERGDPALKAAREQGRINAVYQVPQPARAGNAVVEIGELPQKVEMMLAPFDDVLEIVAGGDRRTGHQQQNLLDRIDNPPRFPVVVELRKLLQKQRQTSSRALVLDDRVHLMLQPNQERRWSHQPRTNTF
jgi:hypothetical protein